MSRSKFRKIKGLYEPSGVIQTEDGSVLAVDDELTNALVLLKCCKQKLKVKSLASWPEHVGKVNDLEAITADTKGRCYAITSHSRTAKGLRKASREKLLGFRLKNGCLTDVIVKSELLTPLADAILAVSEGLDADPQLHDSTAKYLRLIEIEGLVFEPHSKSLFIGLRNPVIDGHAIVIVMHNPDAYLRGDTCELTAIPLYLGGGSIRSITYDSTLDACLIVASEKKKRKNSFMLWMWKPHVDDNPRQFRLKSVKNLRQTEAITEVQTRDQSRLLLLSDEGSARKARPARYLFTDHENFLLD